MLACLAAALALVAILSSAGSDAAGLFDNEPSRAIAEAAFVSINSEWSAAFETQGRRYEPPRLIFVEPPRNHPARGSGYDRGNALIDLGELADIYSLFPENRTTLIALIVAHEIAHHVQFLNGGDRHRPLPSVTMTEQEADCAAGWWLGRANTRALASTGGVLYPTSGLEHGFPRLLNALDLLNYRFSRHAGSGGHDAHGSGPARVARILEGVRAKSSSTCGDGVSAQNAPAVTAPHPGLP